MADIQKLTYPYFTDGTTQLNAANLNPIIAKLNEVIDKVNGGVTPTQTVATPTISISGSTATISCSTSGATIYYTTNGNTPTTSSTQYSSPITLSGACTIKAIAVKSGMTNSSVASQSYTPSSQRSPEAQAVINKFSSMSSANQDKVATFVDSLVSAGIYSKLNYLMIPTVAGSVAEGVQNVLSSVTPPSVSNATVSDGLKMTGVGAIDLNSMINGTFDYQNYTIAIKVENGSSPSGSKNRVLTMTAVPATGTPDGSATRLTMANSISSLGYDGYASSKTFTAGFGIVAHNNTALTETYYTDNALTSATDTKTISVNNGLYLSSNSTAEESDLRGAFSGTYKILVVAGVLSDTEISALATAIDTFLS